MALNILNPGLSTSIQDLGRPGYFHLGIPIGGAMDRFAMRVANMLVGNAEDAAGLEAVFMSQLDGAFLVGFDTQGTPDKVDGKLASTFMMAGKQIGTQ